jgi:hypothetical protein
MVDRSVNLRRSQFAPSVPEGKRNIIAVKRGVEEDERRLATSDDGGLSGWSTSDSAWNGP